MSFDAKLLKYCDHRIIEEDHVVESDLVTFYLDVPIGNIENPLVKVNGVKWDKYNQSEILITEDVTSQITGTNTRFVVGDIPIYDGANKRRLAQRTIDIVVEIDIFDEDASAQFTGTDKLLVTQHRPLISKYDIFATQLTSADIIVKVDTVTVEIDRIESAFGKIFLKDAPLAGSHVVVSYSYRSRIMTFDADSGAIELREAPQIGQQVFISHYYLANDGWSIVYDDTLKLGKVIFDRPKQTNQVLIQTEDESSQFNVPNKTWFYTKYKPLIPPRAKISTQPIQTMLLDFTVLLNGERVLPQNFNAESGRVDLGFALKTGDIVVCSYTYRSTRPADIISIDYSTSINHCRKCRRTGQVNDYDYDKLGEVITVQKEQKMLQDLLKMTTAVKGSNVANAWYGTTLVSYIGTARPSDYYETKFKGELISMGDKMKDLQTQQSQYQKVDNEELLSFLDNVDVKQSDYDPDFYEITATVVSQAGTAIPLDTSLQFNKPLLTKE